MCLLACICTFHTLHSLQWGRGCKIKYCNLSLPLSLQHNCMELFFIFFSAVESSADCAIRSTPSPTAIQPCASDVDGLRQGLDQRTSATEEELFENVKEVCLQPQTGSQHNKVTLIVNLSNGILSWIEKAIIYVVFMLFFILICKVHHQPVEETFCLDTAIIKLQTELHKVQTEKDVLSDLR